MSKFLQITLSLGLTLLLVVACQKRILVEADHYERNGELLAMIFHPPILEEEYGTHEDRECVVGRHRGHAVAVGEWSLVHVTDPTTCHCILSRLDPSSELPTIIAEVVANLAWLQSSHP